MKKFITTCPSCKEYFGKTTLVLEKEYLCNACQYLAETSGFDDEQEARDYETDYQYWKNTPQKSLLLQLWWLLCYFIKDSIYYTKVRFHGRKLRKQLNNKEN